MTFPGIATWPYQHAARDPDRIAIRTATERIDRAGFARRVATAARALHAAGVRRGDRIAYHGGNEPVALVSLFAARSVGAIWVPIHPGRPDADVAAIVDDASPRFVVFGGGADSRDIGVDAIDLDADARAAGDPEDRDVAGDIAILAYTSGTTGRPKGVPLSEANIHWDVVQMLMVGAFSAGDVTLAAAPFSRMGGIGVTVLPTLFVGGTVLIPPEVEGASLLRTIADERVTVVFANPELFDRMRRSDAWRRADLSHVRMAIVGGGLVPEPLIRTYLDAGVALQHGYGLTEAAPVVSVLAADDVAVRPASVGRPLPFVDVRVVRPDATPCAPGEIGEWEIRGPNVFAGYRGDPASVDPHGWFRTGDVGTLDEQGYLTFVDRASSRIRIGDVDVYPTVAEGAVYGAGGVAEVGVADVDGAIVAAVVVLDGTTLDLDGVRARLREAVPSTVPVGVAVVDRIPRNASEKVLRDDLRAQLGG
jgi:fatty-acyl-CoA synthase